MDELTCPSPVGVPEDLAIPGPSYFRGVGLALATLVAFLATYLALTIWFVWTAARLMLDAFGGNQDALALLGVVPSLFFSFFMLKALFFRERGQSVTQVEIDASAEPRLFAFLYRLADEAGAPRPRRVFLSTRVNAGVFYDLSVLSLIFPSRKNLEIGLGLVNVLTLGEVRAVIAHEYGHFAQRAMAVGRWVGIAQRIAAQIVHRRDAIDGFLVGISASDIRLAWIGWIARTVVWALRAVLDSAFSLVVRARSTLAHEMERQADLVAVSLTGSDALVSALHKLGGADVAWEHVLGLVGRKHAKSEDVADLFALQSRVIEHGRRVLDDPNHGAAPPLPLEGRAQHRVFKHRIANPPRMWSSHPPNREREDNMKRIYVSCDSDDRSAWILFSDPEGTRAKLTETLLATLPKPATPAKKLSLEESLHAVDESFDHAYFEPRFRGLYLGRSAVRSAKVVSDLYLPSDQAAALSIDALYSAELRDALARWKALAGEVVALEGLQRGLLKSGTAEIQFRGETLRKRDLPRALAAVQTECSTARLFLEERDREHRSAHLAAAEHLGQGWPEYLRSLAALLHYADHAEADLGDARGYLANVFGVVTADGRVSRRERARLAGASCDVHDALTAIWAQREQIRLPASVAERLGVDRWAAALPEELKLPPPTFANIPDWMSAVDSWIGAFLGPLDNLERKTLETLLEAETKVAALAQEPSSAGPAPSPAATPAEYATLVPGTERERQWKLGRWERFQVADGRFWSLARFAVAGGVVAGMIALGMSLGGSRLVIYNGLAQSLVVRVGDKESELSSFQRVVVDVPSARTIHIVTKTSAGEVVEAFDEDVERTFDRLVYNVAGAAPLVRWTASYGNAAKEPPKALGAPRWSTTDAAFLFEDPPKLLQSGVPSETKTVLSGGGDIWPDAVLASLPDSSAREAVVRAHALWDAGDRRWTGEWLSYAERLPDFERIVSVRLSRDPRDLTALRAEQAQPDPSARAEACKRQRRLVEIAPNDGDLQYLEIRCRPDGTEQDDAFIGANQVHPDSPWLAFAAGLALSERGDWGRALSTWEAARGLDVTAEAVSTDSARVMRLFGPERERDLRKLTSDDARLRELLALETFDAPHAGPGAAYHALWVGGLTDALATPDLDDVTRARLVRLVGASRGATREQIDNALALPLESGLDADTIWPAIGLALREKKDVTKLMALVDKLVRPDDRPALLSLVAPNGLVDAEGGARAATLRLEPGARGHAYVLSCVLRGQDAPQIWRAIARELLFAPEGPYF